MQKNNLIKNTWLLLILLMPGYSSLSWSADNALSEAIPHITQLNAEKCSASQSKLLESLGLGQMACTISKHINFDSLSKSLGISAFQSNSRTNPLDPSDNVEDFVRYSPNFFTRLNELYLEDTDRFMYGFIYRNLLANSTRLFYLNGKVLRGSKAYSSLNLEQYKKAIAEAKTLHKSTTAYCKETHKTITKKFGTNDSYEETFQQCGKSGTATLFWYRRKLDGSGDALFTLLDNILKTQDAAFYQQIQTIKHQ